jgi:hypothetical protein
MVILSLLEQLLAVNHIPSTETLTYSLIRTNSILTDG